MPTSSRTLRAALLAAALFPAACGKKGPPLPPFRPLPFPVSGLEIGQRGEQMIVSYRAPSATADGRALETVEVELVFTGEKGRRLARQRLRVAPGERRTESHPLPSPGTPVVVTARARHKGRWSALVKAGPFRVQESLPAPSGVIAQNDPAGVLITWSHSASDDSPGYLVRRRLSGGDFKELAAKPVPAPPYIDDTTAPGQTYCYAVRRVASIAPPLVSADSPEACLEAKDVRPPSPPTDVTALPQRDRIDLSWGAVSDSDLASYRLYRSSGGEPKRIAELPAAQRSFEDKDVAPGAQYRYTVTAVDGRGNESASSSPVTVALP